MEARSEVRGLGAPEDGEMSSDSLSSSSHGGIDDHISQLMQCRPLSEQQVRILEAPPIDPRSVVFVMRGSRIPIGECRVRIARSGMDRGSFSRRCDQKLLFYFWVVAVWRNWF